MPAYFESAQSSWAVTMKNICFGVRLMLGNLAIPLLGPVKDNNEW